MTKAIKVLALGGIIAIVACWPFAVGKIVEDKITAKESLGNSAIKVEMVDYHRGYLTSQSSSKITILDPSLIKTLESFRLPDIFYINNNMRHGFFGVNAESKFAESPNSIVRIESSYSIFGEASMTLIIDPFKVGSEDEPIENGGIRIKISGNKNEITSISFDVEKFYLTYLHVPFIDVNKLSINFDGELSKNTMYLPKGKQSINVDSLNISDGDSLYATKGLAVTINNTIENTNYVSNSSFKLASFDGTEPNYSYDIKDLTFNSSSRIDLISLSKLSASLMNLMIGKNQSLIKELILARNNLAKNGGEFALNDLSFLLGGTNIEGNLMLNFAPSNYVSNDDISALKTSLSGKMDLSVDKTIMEQYPKLEFGKMIMDKFKINALSETEQAYEMEAEIKDSQLKFKEGYEASLDNVFYLISRL